MVCVGWKMLRYRKARLITSVVGIGVAFFLCAAQVGLLIGWCDTTTAIVRHADVDLWVVARNTSAFDYGQAMPERRIQQVRSVKGVAWAQGMLMTWVLWQQPDGKRAAIELVGLDEDLVGGPWQMSQGRVTDVHRPHGVIIDELYLGGLGVKTVGEEVEILGHRAEIVAVSAEVRTFTAAPFVFTSLHNARVYDPYYRADEITYVLVRCEPGANIETVRAGILAELPSVEVLTSGEFARRTIEYWMLETGVGITVVVTAILGFIVGVMIASQNLFATTQENLGEYASLMAIGFGRWQLVGVVFSQAMTLGISGVVLGSILFVVAARYSAGTPVVIETNLYAFSATALTSIVGCAIASLMSARALFQIDPVTVFQR